MSQNERPSEGAGNDPVSISTTNQSGKANPIGVEVTRGPIVESRHRGSVAIVDVAGKVRVAWGDIAQPVYPRSAIKALQAIPAIESGMADAIGLSKSELALLCSSHGGEPRHTETAAGILQRVGLSEADLECGTHWPSHEESAYALAASRHVRLLPTTSEPYEPPARAVGVRGYLGGTLRRWKARACACTAGAGGSGTE